MKMQASAAYTPNTSILSYHKALTTSKPINFSVAHAG